jgi:hypothetical protein
MLAFNAVIRIVGVNPYVPVSALRASALKKDWRKPMPVLVRVNGEPAKKPWRINMMPVGKGGFYLYLHGHVRNALGTKVGDRVSMEVQFDAAYRPGPMPMPAWFRVPLSKNATAKAAWQALTPSRQKEIVRYLAHLKSPEARARNVERALRVLSGTKERYMARSW